LIADQVCLRGVDFELKARLIQNANSGVSFEGTGEIESELTYAGARSELIEAVRNNFHRQLGAPSLPRDQGGEFVLIPPGTFRIGSTNGEEDERDGKEITITYSFYMGKHEVTQAQWQEVMGTNPPNFKNCCSDCPAERVSWDDAQRFIDQLNKRADGFRYRLPTESEWEYACRAGTTGDYAGNLDNMAWYLKNSAGGTHPVGKKKPNAWGLADMHGNVWEWCEDWYHDNYKGAPTDGSAWLSGGEQKYRVLRGGSWSNAAASLRSAFRLGSYPSGRVNTIGFGFRVVAIERYSPR
jgi:formylglycine-generating enzyme required for sulfatase activity